MRRDLLALIFVTSDAAVLHLLPLQPSQATHGLGSRWERWPRSTSNVSLEFQISQAEWGSAPLELWGRAVEPKAKVTPEPAELEDLNGVLYTVEAQVNGASLRLAVDTGSSDIWAKVSPLEGQKVNEWLVKKGDQVVRPELTLRFGMGNVLGIPVVLPRFCVSDICTKNQDVVLAERVAGMSDVEDFDGLLGLALPRDSQNPFGTTFVSRLMQKGPVAFALSLAESPFLAFGPRRELLKGLEQAHRLPVFPTSAGLTMWTVAMGLNISDAHGTTLLAAQGFGALDSGSTLLVMPDQLFLAVLTHLLKPPFRCQFDISILCMCNQELQDLWFTFGELRVKFTKDELLVPVAEGACRLNLMPMPPAVKGLPLLILGQVFLQKVYTVFDPLGPAVYLAPPREAAAAEAVWGFHDQGSAWPLLAALVSCAVAAASGLRLCHAWWTARAQADSTPESYRAL